MKPEPDKRSLSPLKCSPFINTHLIEEICHNFRDVRVNDVEKGMQQWISAGVGGIIGCLFYSFGGRWERRGGESKSTNMFRLTNLTLSFYTQLLQQWYIIQCLLSFTQSRMSSASVRATGKIKDKEMMKQQGVCLFTSHWTLNCEVCCTWPDLQKKQWQNSQS